MPLHWIIYVPLLFAGRVHKSIPAWHARTAQVPLCQSASEAPNPDTKVSITNPSVSVQLSLAVARLRSKSRDGIVQEHHQILAFSSHVRVAEVTPTAIRGRFRLGQLHKHQVNYN